MNKHMAVSDWVFGVLNYGEEFTSTEIQIALNALAEAEKKRVNRNLSYLAKTGKVKRLQRGKFKCVIPREDFSLALRSAYCENFRTKEEVDARVDTMKINRSPCEFIEIPLWNYKKSTGNFYHLQKTVPPPKYHNTEFLLVIDADDPQLKRVLRYATKIVNGAILIILIHGIADIRKLFPKLKWF